MEKQWKQWLTLFVGGGSKITADGDCSHEIKRCLLLGRKVMTNLDNILKSRVITLPTKVHLVKAMVFPVVMYGCESWTIKKAECWRIDTFELWCWRRLFFFPPIIFISWRLINLQYCSGFCHTLTWISHGFTCVPHPETPPTTLLIPSLWVIPVHQPQALVSCIQPGLTICFSIETCILSSGEDSWESLGLQGDPTSPS